MHLKLRDKGWTELELDVKDDDRGLGRLLPDMSDRATVEVVAKGAQ